MTNEQERVKSIIAELDKDKDRGDYRIYNSDKKQFELVSDAKDPDAAMKVVPEDFDFFGKKHSRAGIIVLSGELLESLRETETATAVYFNCCDDGDVYTLFENDNSRPMTPGTLYLAKNGESPPVSEIGSPQDRVRVIIKPDGKKEGQAERHGSFQANGYILDGKKWTEITTQIVPVKSEIYSRIGGIFETDAIADRLVTIFGIGSGGSAITLELAKSGVRNFFLMDHDRVEVGNLSRHVACISDIGRYKTKVLTQLIKQKNPFANVQTWEEKVSFENIEKVRKIVKQSHIVICATDDRPSRLIINRICVEERKNCIFAGAFRRAYGGQVLLVRPYETPCYQCFLMHLPEKAEDIEISNREHADALAYTDRPVPIEPGLSTDIAPISLMVVKLVIQELLKGSETTLRSLDDDLVASYYIWLNRRESGTQYQKLKPLALNVSGLHVLRWYGIKIERHPACSVCGNFEESLGFKTRDGAAYQKIKEFSKSES